MVYKQNYDSDRGLHVHSLREYGRDITVQDAIDDADSLFEAIGNYGEATYMGPGRKLAEELALSIACYRLKEIYGRRTDSGKRTLRHLIVFGGTGAKKSSMVSFYVDKLFSDVLSTGNADIGTNAAITGTVGKDTITVSPLTRHDLVTLEWDSLVKQGREIQDVMNKALEEGVVSKHTAMTSSVSDELREAREAKEQSESASGLDAFQSEKKLNKRTRRAMRKQKKYGLEFDGTEMRSPVDSVLLGICHLDSEFWSVYDRSFYRRMFPVYVEPPHRDWDMELEYRRDNKKADVGELRELLTDRLFVDLDENAFPEPKPEFFSKEVKDTIGTDDSSIHNSMFMTGVAKALLDGKVVDGKIQMDSQTEQWLRDRIIRQYSEDINELDDTVVATQNPTNELRKYRGKARKMDLLELVVDSPGITREALAKELEVAEQRVDQIVESGTLSKVISREFNADTEEYRFYIDV